VFLTEYYGFSSDLTQVLATALAVGYFTFLVSGASGPAAIVIGNGLALSSTAVVLQVCNLLTCFCINHFKRLLRDCS